MTEMTDEIRRSFSDWLKRLARGEAAVEGTEAGFRCFCGGTALSGTAEEICRQLSAALNVLPASIEDCLFQVDQLDADTALVTACPEPGQVQAGVVLSAVCRHTAVGCRVRHLQITLPPLDETAQQALTAHIPGGVQRCLDDAYFTLDEVSDSFVALFGYSREEIRDHFHNRYIEMIWPEDREAVMTKTSQANGSMVTEYRVRCRDGRVIWVLDQGQRVQSHTGAGFLYCVLLDNTEAHLAQERLRQSEQRYRIILDQTTDILFEWDVRRDMLDCSANWEKKFGYTPISRDLRRQLPQTRHIHPDDLEAFLTIMYGTAGGEPYLETEFRIRQHDGRFIWCRVRATTLFDESGAPDKVVGVILDIDSEKKLSIKLRERAERDALTKLYNRGATEAHIDEFLARDGKAGRHALLILDIDNFKQMNDQRGHLFGDKVLTDLSTGLHRIFRTSDVVGRIGGDEFVVLMKDVRDKTIVQQKAQEMQAVFRHLPADEGHPLSGSIGIAVFPADGTAYHELFRHADEALYAAKKRGKDSFIFHDENKGA